MRGFLYDIRTTHARPRPVGCEARNGRRRGVRGDGSYMAGGARVGVREMVNVDDGNSEEHYQSGRRRQR